MADDYDDEEEEVEEDACGSSGGRDVLRPVRKYKSNNRSFKKYS